VLCSIANMHWIKNKEEKYFRLLERVYPEPRLKCGLADSSEGSEKGQCRACTFKIGEFEFDDVLEQLIRNGQIRNGGIHRAHLCPYQVFAGMLLGNLDDGPEAERVENWKRGLAIRNLERAKKNIAGALAVFGHDIEIHKDADEFYRRLEFVRRSQGIIGKAITAIKAVYKEPKPKTGHPGKLDAQAITEACLTSWRLLVGKEAGKNNTQFQELLSKTWISVHGAKKEKDEPDWEYQIKAAKKRRTVQ
jgi:hypothetical protein